MICRRLKYGFFALVFLLACKPNKPVESVAYHGIQGTTMGTYYKITYKGERDLVTQFQIDSLLVKLNAALSTYEKHSVISQFNNLGQITLSRMEPIDLFFIEVYERSKYWYKQSDGQFDPTVMPLVNYWGFGYQDKPKIKEVDQVLVAELVSKVGMSKITDLGKGDRYTVMKQKEMTELDFSAIAKGYAVDHLAHFLGEQGITHYLIDIGGELIAKGVNHKSKAWTIGISKPLENSSSTELALLVTLKDVALASSGNYRNFYESEGAKYSHTINPKKGYPERSDLLGVSVISDNCMDADAVATSCMVKGLAAAKSWVGQLKNVEACFIYNDSDTLAIDYSSGFEEYLINQ